MHAPMFSVLSRLKEEKVNSKQLGRIDYTESAVAGRLFHSARTITTTFFQFTKMPENVLKSPKKPEFRNTGRTRGGSSPFRAGTGGRAGTRTGLQEGRELS